VNNLVILGQELPSAGALVYWRLNGELSPGHLSIPWVAAGLAEALLPQTPAPSTALARAMRELGSQRKMIRPLDRRGAHALVSERAKDGDLTYDVELKASLDAAGRPVFTPAGHPYVNKVRADYSRHLDECSSDDVGAWLCKIVRRMDGVALRDTGGFYYIPPTRLAEWTRVVECLAQVSGHRVFQIPAMNSPDTVAAVVDAVEQEAAQEAANMEAELTEGKLGERALNNRYKQCENVEQKVQRYEALLGRGLDTLRTRLEQLRANLAAAAILASEDEGAAA
jgi:hypothetical protein